MSKKMLVCCRSLFILCLTATAWQQAFAQGQDSTRADRDIMIMAELLPGDYRNANQAYFDFRLKNPEAERHQSVYTTIERIADSDIGEWVFSSRSGNTKGGVEPRHYLHLLSVDNEIGAVRMKNYTLDSAPSQATKIKDTRYQEGCDLLFRQQSGQFHGAVDETTCEVDQATVSDVQLTEDALWLKYGDPNLSHYALDRSRQFSCYIDVPGVGGGRDIPYERFELDDMHDLGAEKWITTKDGMEIGVNLFRVQWVMNNYEGIFTRPSFVIYVKTKDEEGNDLEKGYAFTEPSAQRIGINLKWMLANCYMVSNEDVVPFFRTNEPKL